MCDAAFWLRTQSQDELDVNFRQHANRVQPYEDSEPSSRSYRDEELLNPKEAARFLGVSAKTLANARVSGKSPPYSKPFGRIRYRFRDLDEYVAARRRSSTSDGGRPI